MSEPESAPAPSPEAAPLPVTSSEPAPAPAPVETITLSEIMNSREVIARKEAADRETLESIGTIPSDTLRGQLIQWATAGFPNNYRLKQITITPPGVCSDGITRSLSDYIQHCSTKTIHEHIGILQARLPDIMVAFTFDGSNIAIVLLKV